MRLLYMASALVTFCFGALGVYLGISSAQRGEPLQSAGLVILLASAACLYAAWLLRRARLGR
jgi:hypothetical protein